jgi:hypothetical protein
VITGKYYGQLYKLAFLLKAGEKKSYFESAHRGTS